jgi:hypothetical protein
MRRSSNQVQLQSCRIHAPRQRNDVSRRFLRGQGVTTCCARHRHGRRAASGGGEPSFTFKSWSTSSYRAAAPALSTQDQRPRTTIAWLTIPPTGCSTSRQRPRRRIRRWPRPLPHFSEASRGAHQFETPSPVGNVCAEPETCLSARTLRRRAATWFNASTPMEKPIAT